jgi:hypothetical protein
VTELFSAALELLMGLLLTILMHRQKRDDQEVGVQARFEREAEE